MCCAHVGWARALRCRRVQRAATCCPRLLPSQLPAPHPAHLGGHAAAEERRGGEVAAMAGVCCAHHVLGVPHLLRQLGHRQAAVLLAAAGGEWRKAHLGREGGGGEGRAGWVGRGERQGGPAGLAERGKATPSKPPQTTHSPQAAAPTMKKCRRGKGMRFTASLRRSELSWPGNRRQHVMPARGGGAGGGAGEAWGQGGRRGNERSSHTAGRAGGRETDMHACVHDRAPAHPPSGRPAALTGHDGGDEVVQVTERGRGQLQGAEADVVQRLIVLQGAGGDGGGGG